MPLWWNSRYPLFYIFVHNRSQLSVLPNFNLIRTLKLAVFGPLFPRMFGHHYFFWFQALVEELRKWCHFVKNAAWVGTITTVIVENCTNIWPRVFVIQRIAVRKWLRSTPKHESFFKFHRFERDCFRDLEALGRWRIRMDGRPNRRNLSGVNWKGSYWLLGFVSPPSPHAIPLCLLCSC